MQRVTWRDGDTVAEQFFPAGSLDPHFKEGYVHKRGEWPNKNFQVRWFQLDEYDLKYFSADLVEREKGIEKGHIDMREVTSVRRGEDASAGPSEIHVVTKTRTWVFKCDFLAEAEEWEHELKAAQAKGFTTSVAAWGVDSMVEGVTFEDITQNIRPVPYRLGLTPTHVCLYATGRRAADSIGDRETAMFARAPPKPVHKYRLADFSEVSEVSGEWFPSKYVVQAQITRPVEAKDQEAAAFADGGVTSALVKATIKLRFDAKSEAELVKMSMRSAADAKRAMLQHPANGGGGGTKGYSGDRATMPMSPPRRNASSERNIALSPTGAAAAAAMAAATAERRHSWEGNTSSWEGKLETSM
jgi:hypothetical protein